MFSLQLSTHFFNILFIYSLINAIITSLRFYQVVTLNSSNGADVPLRTYSTNQLLLRSHLHLCLTTDSAMLMASHSQLVATFIASAISLLIYVLLTRLQQSCVPRSSTVNTGFIDKHCCSSVFMLHRHCLEQSSPVVKFSWNGVPPPVSGVPPPKVVDPPPGNDVPSPSGGIVATRGQTLRLKCTKYYFGWGFAPDPAGEITALAQNS